MAESGRALTLNWNGTAIAGVRTRGYSARNELVDVTSDDSNGWQTFLPVAGVRGFEITVGGVTENQVLLADLMTGQFSRTMITNLPTTTGTLNGIFMIQEFNEEGEHDGAVEFTATFQSSGPVTFTAGVID